MNETSRTYNATRNITYGLINKLLVLILTFISRTIFVKVLAIEYLGINGLFSDVLMMLSLADLGFGTAMAYSFYKPLAEKDEGKIAALITFYKHIYNIIATSVAVIGLCLAPFIKHIIVSNNEIAYINLYYLIFLANTVISYLFVYKSSIINADQKSYIITKYSMWISVIKLVAQSFVLVFFKNFFIYLIVNTLSILINNLMISKRANSLYPFIKNKAKLNFYEKKSIYKNMWSVFLYKLSSSLINGTDNILISTLIGTAYVGYYSNYSILTTSIGSIISLVFNALTSSLGNLIVTADEESRYRVFNKLQFFCFYISGLCAMILLFLCNQIITLWFDNSYVLDNIVLEAITINFYIGLTLPPIWSFREATGLYRKTKYIMCITAFLNIFLSILLGKLIGLSGIIFATAISRLATYFWYEPLLLFREYFHKKTLIYFIGQFKNLFIFVISIVATKIVLINIIDESIISLLIKAVIIFLIYTSVFIITNVNNNEFIFLRGRIKSLFFRKRKD